MTRHARTGYRRCGASPPQLSSGPLGGDSEFIQMKILVLFVLSSCIVAHNVALAQNDTARSATVAAFATVSAPTGDFSSSYQVGFALKLAFSKSISPRTSFILDFSAAWNNFKTQELQSQLPTDVAAQIDVPPMKSLYLVTGIGYVISASTNQQLNAFGEIGAECVLPSTMTINFPAVTYHSGIGRSSSYYKHESTSGCLCLRLQIWPKSHVERWVYHYNRLFNSQSNISLLVLLEWWATT